jgi:hypothetical protein
VFEDTASALLGVDGLQVTGVEAAPGRRHRGVSGHGVRGRGGLSGGGTVSDRVHETVIPRPVTSRAGPPGDETILEAALATVTTPSGQPGTPITPAALADALDWSLKRLDTALAALTDHLAGTGIRIDTDPAPASTPLRGLRARDRHLTDEQRAALHRLRHATAPLDADAARVLYAVAHPGGTLTEGDAADPATVVALQQRGIIRRRARAGYLELTDDARFSLAPEPPAPDRSALT